MKLKSLLSTLCICIFLSATSVNAQENDGGKTDADGNRTYRNSVGLTLGSSHGIGMKFLRGDHFAASVDLGMHVVDALNTTVNVNELFYSVESNANFMGTWHFSKGLMGFAGAGVSLGYETQRHLYWGFSYYDPEYIYYKDFGKCGANGIIGLEYKFKAPIVLSVDFRPGWAFLFDYEYLFGYFDWGANLGIRFAL